MHRSNKKSCLAEVDTALNNGRSMSDVDALALFNLPAISLGASGCGTILKWEPYHPAQEWYDGMMVYENGDLTQ